MAKVLIVEDEMLVALHLEGIVSDLGFEPVGIASDAAQALELHDAKPDIALVDLNLRDGPTGPEIGRRLALNGVSVVFVTANPGMLGRGVRGTLGVMSKPCDDESVSDALNYALAHRNGVAAAPPPDMRTFALSA